MSLKCMGQEDGKQCTVDASREHWQIYAYKDVVTDLYHRIQVAIPFCPTHYERIQGALVGEIDHEAGMAKFFTAFPDPLTSTDPVTLDGTDDSEE